MKGVGYLPSATIISVETLPASTQDKPNSSWESNFSYKLGLYTSGIFSHNILVILK